MHLLVFVNISVELRFFRIVCSLVLEIKICVCRSHARYVAHIRTYIVFPD
jgi:hypothetical protein